MKEGGRRMRSEPPSCWSTATRQGRPQLTWPHTATTTLWTSLLWSKSTSPPATDDASGGKVACRILSLLVRLFTRARPVPVTNAWAIAVPPDPCWAGHGIPSLRGRPTGPASSPSMEDFLEPVPLQPTRPTPEDPSHGELVMEWPMEHPHLGGSSFRTATGFWSPCKWLKVRLLGLVQKLKNAGYPLFHFVFL